MDSKMTSVGWVARNKKDGQFAGHGCRCKVYSSRRVAYASVRTPMSTFAQVERIWDFQEVFVAAPQVDDQEAVGASIDRVTPADFTAKI